MLEKEVFIFLLQALKILIGMHTCRQFQAFSILHTSILNVKFKKMEILVLVLEKEVFIFLLQALKILIGMHTCRQFQAFSILHTSILNVKFKKMEFLKLNES